VTEIRTERFNAINHVMPLRHTPEHLGKGKGEGDRKRGRRKGIQQRKQTGGMERKEREIKYLHGMVIALMRRGRKDGGRTRNFCAEAVVMSLVRVVSATCMGAFCQPLFFFSHSHPILHHQFPLPRVFHPGDGYWPW
jgi:hypothetical protein